MVESSGIGWTHNTHNEWIGCTEVGEGRGCATCYARTLDAKYQFGLPPDVAKANRAAGVAPHWGDGSPRYRTSEANRRKPYAWNRKADEIGVPTMVFCNSLSDVFDNEVPEEWRASLFKTWKETPWLRWQVLTKRVPNIRKMLPADWGEEGYPNVGLVGTVVDQKEFDRDAPRLLDIPASWHGFSMEPQLGAISLRTVPTSYRGSIWCITGGDSRQRKDVAPREYNVAWAEELIADSLLFPNVYVYVKQTGANPVGCAAPSDGMGKDPERWPPSIRVQNFPPELLR